MHMYLRTPPTERTNRVLLLAGVGGAPVMRLPRLLADAGLEVTLLAPRFNAAHFSRFVRRRLYVPAGPKHVVAAAKKLLAGEGASRFRWIVLADEPTLQAAADDPGALAEQLPFPSTPGFWEVALSKNRFLAACRAQGVNVPRFEIGATQAEAPFLAEKIGYPVLIKPIRGLGGNGIRLLAGRPELETLFATEPPQEEYVLQAVIPGKSGSTSILYDHGRPVCWFSYFMERTWPNRFGPANLIRVCDHPDVETLAGGIGGITRFHGLSGFDWMLDERTGRLALLEFNPRPTPIYHLGLLAGVDFSAALAQWICGGRVHLPRRPEPPPRTMRLFPQALDWAIDNGSAAELLRAFGDAPWSDPLLLLAQLRLVAGRHLPGRRHGTARVPRAVGG